MELRTREDFDKWYSKPDPWNYQKQPDDLKKKETVLSMFPKRHYRNVLDVGCGEGWITKDISSWVSADRVIGIDISITAIERARQQDPTGLYAQGQFPDFHSFVMPTFDLILLMDVLQYVDFSKAVNFLRTHLMVNGDIITCYRDNPNKSKEDFIEELQTAGYRLLQKKKVHYGGLPGTVASFTNKPAISIITCTYNRDTILPRCIDSVQQQRFQSWEHIIVDDGSTDNTRYVVGSYGDPRIKYVRRDINSVEWNRGDRYRVNPTNDGMRAASGSYFCHLDDDDRFRLGRFEQSFQLLEEGVADLVYCDSLLHRIVNNRLVLERDRSKHFNSQLLQERNFIGSCEPLYRAFDAFTGPILWEVPYNNDGKSSGDDWKFWKRLSTEGYRFHHLPDILCEIFDSTNKDHPANDFWKFPCPDTYLTDEMTAKRFRGQVEERLFKLEDFYD